MNSQCVTEFQLNTHNFAIRLAKIGTHEPAINTDGFCLNRTRFTWILLNNVVGKCTILWAKMFTYYIHLKSARTFALYRIAGYMVVSVFLHTHLLIHSLTFSDKNRENREEEKE